MKRRFKRILSVLLVVVMIVGSAPLSGFAGLDLPNLADLFTLKADAATESGKCGDNLTWSLDTDTGVLTISGTGDMYNWDYSDDVPWYSNRSSIKTVVIGDSVTSIGACAFYNCTGLTSVTIPDSVTSIGEAAFYSTGVYNNSSNWENDVLYIGNHLIKAKTSISGDYLVKSGTKTIAGRAFSGCTGLTSVTIPDSVTSIGDWAFWGCAGLTSITIGNSVTSIGDEAFFSCTGLTSITIPDSVTSIGWGAFGGCKSLTSVTIPDSVTSIGYCAFYSCTGLTSITVKEGNPNYSSDEYGVLFNKDKTLLIRYPIGNTRTSYTIPDSVTSIGSRAFEDCTRLTDVYYTGSEEEWQSISIGDYNECLTNATIHYNYVLEPETVNITDERTGIQVSAPGGTFDGDVTLKVEEVLSGSSFDIIGKVNGKSKTKVFTIETYVDGQSVQPNGDVTVRIPVPDGFNAEKCKLYYLNTSSKNPEEIAFRVEDGYIVFTTNRFGDWAIIQTAEMPTVSVNDIGLNYKKSVALNPSVTVDENASYTVTYTSSDTSVARVDENGKVYGAKKGSTEITVTVTDEYGNTVSDTCKVNVTYAWWQWIIVIVLFGWIWY